MIAWGTYVHIWCAIIVIGAMAGNIPAMITGFVFGVFSVFLEWVDNQ